MVYVARQARRLSTEASARLRSRPYFCAHAWSLSPAARHAWNAMLTVGVAQIDVCELIPPEYPTRLREDPDRWWMERCNAQEPRGGPRASGADPAGGGYAAFCGALEAGGIGVRGVVRCGERALAIERR